MDVMAGPVRGMELALALALAWSWPWPSKFTVCKRQLIVHAQQTYFWPLESQTKNVPLSHPYKTNLITRHTSLQKKCTHRQYLHQKCRCNTNTYSTQHPIVLCQGINILSFRLVQGCVTWVTLCARRIIDTWLHWFQVWAIVHASGQLHRLQSLMMRVGTGEHPRSTGCFILSNVVPFPCQFWDKCVFT